MRWSIVTLLYLGFASARHEEYDGHALFSVSTQNEEQVKYFNGLEYPLDIWQYGSLARDGLVLVPKTYFQLFEKELSSRGMDYVIKVENIKESLDLEDRLLSEKRHSRSAAVNRNGPSLNFDNIYTLTQVNDYLRSVAAANPNVATLVNGGRTMEGREINYLKISTTNFGNTRKPIIFINSLLHAREWISLPVSLYAIDKLVVNVTDPDLLEQFDWIILPVANPDGYEFSHKSNRFWHKNRRTGVFPNDICMGVDLNRNFDIAFGTDSSSSPCSENYHGTSAFSEPETQVIRDILREYMYRIALYLDVHSFGSKILYGWGTGQLPSNLIAQHTGSIRMAMAIDAVRRPYNLIYTVGSAAFLYPASGTAMDYASVSGVPLSYVYELPGYRGGGQTELGYLVRPDFIQQAGMETWEGIKAGARYVLTQ